MGARTPAVTYIQKELNFKKPCRALVTPGSTPASWHPLDRHERKLEKPRKAFAESFGGDDHPSSTAPLVRIHRQILRQGVRYG
jgi:hypothetical protein